MPNPDPPKDRASDVTRQDSPNCVFIAGSVTHNWDFVVNGMRITIESCRRTNPALPIYAIVDSATPEVQRALEGCELIVIDPPEEQKGLRQDLGVGTFFRFFVHRLPPYRKALYLDGDTVVLGDLTPLFERDGPLLARRYPKALDTEFVDPERIMLREGVCDPAPCVNGGVILFDMEYWGNGELEKEFLSISEEYGWSAFKNMDQGIMDIVCWRRGIDTTLPWTFNTFAPDVENDPSHRPEVSNEGISYPRMSGEKVDILHYVGPVKPWGLYRDGYSLSGSRCFRYYEQFLPWRTRIYQHVAVYPNFVRRKLKAFLSRPKSP